MIRSLSLAVLSAASALAVPMSLEARDDAQCRGISGPFLDPSFPDPSFLNVDNTYYSFGTYNGKDVQAAKSSDFTSGWSRLDGSILAISEATWSGVSDGGYTIWAPDVYQRSDGKFVMYFAANDKETIGEGKKLQHCIGAAISDNVQGVYHPQSDFVQCNRTSSGVIDPAWFKDTDGKQYVVYKTEIPQNFLEIREVANSGDREGVEWTSNAVKLIALNSQGFNDAGNIEAPFIFKRGDVYFLTYSTHFTGDGTYDVQYATAKSVLGPYTRVKEPLFKTTDAFNCKLTGPGGASFERDSHGDEKTVKVILHGLTAAMDINKRVVYTTTVDVDGDKLSVKS